MTITIKINTANDAFEDDPDAETIRILEWVVNDWRAIHAARLRKVYDLNGNPVGEVKVKGL